MRAPFFSLNLTEYQVLWFGQLRFFNQLHCSFSQEYLRPADASQGILGVTLQVSYDFFNVAEQAERLDIIVVVLQHLAGGKSKVGFSNSLAESNMLPKDVEDKAYAELEGRMQSQIVKLEISHRLSPNTGDGGQGIQVGEPVEEKEEEKQENTMDSGRGRGR